MSMNVNDCWCVYFISDGKFTKIGHTKNVMDRVNALQTGNPKKLFIQKTFYTESKEQACWLERLLHSYYKNQRTAGEWFDLFRIDGEPTEEYLTSVIERNLKLIS